MSDLPRITVQNFLIGVFLLVGNALTAQPLQPERLEIELGKLENPYQVESLNEHGVMLYRMVEQLGIGPDQMYEFVRYDTAFNEVWRQTYGVSRRFNLIGWDFHRDSIYWLFDQYSPTANYLLVKMGLNVGDTTMKEVRKVVPLRLTEFESVGDALIFGGYVNGRSTVLLHNRFDGKTRVLPNFYEEQSELMELSVNDQDDTFDVSVLTKEPRVPYKLTLRTFDDEGLLLREQDITLPEGLNVLYGRTANQLDGRKVIAGTFSDRRSDYTKGIFVGNLLEDGEVDYYTYAYEELDNFFNYMKTKRRNRVKARIDRRRIKGRKARFSYRLLVHDIIEQNGYYVMVGEAFYPVYRYYGSGGIGGGGAGTSNSTYFDGYRYTHSVVIAFTPDGKVLWNNSFEIEGIQSVVLQEFVKVHVNRDRIVLLYLFDGEIRSKVIRGDTMEEGKFFDPIALKFGSEIVQRNEDNVSFLDRWYGDYFYASGVQEIRKLRRGGAGERRRVFYINKIIYP
ncbi:MAG TPA: hypothetical protein DCE41_07190 [Cytophagales bacterium]|nr:hypothetical protein [Cytophagales bacterium]HAA19611.1 hypothetical protein [Cytophagales bacterium]HAP60279.1 hypothetical protein [Cytophagales bacterium]